MYLIFPLSVADAAAISYSHIQHVPWFLLPWRQAGLWTRERWGERRGETTCEQFCVLIPQSGLLLRWNSGHVSVGYLSSSGWHPHTFSFITNASAAKLELTDEHSYLRLRDSAGIYLPNSAPIDPEEFISIVTWAHKFSFAPPGQGYCCYHSTDDWTLA